MKRLNFTAALTALLLGGCAPTANETTPVATKVAAVPTVGANGRIDANPALWVVKDADTTIYLFGTVHVLKANIDWFDGGLKRAFDASGDVIVEMIQPEDAAGQQVIMRRATDPDGPALTAKMTPAAATKYRAALAANGLPAAQFEAFEPWFVATVLSQVVSQKMGYEGDSGVEQVLTTAAKSAGKPIGELETFDQQIGYFDNLPEPVQLRFLNLSIDQLPEARTQMESLVSSWVAGDPERLAGVMNEGLNEVPEIGRVLLTERNARWAQWVDDRLDRPGTTFVAVGAGHLAGTESVQAMLAKRGFKVTRVQ